jgi:hypothetical protein
MACMKAFVIASEDAEKGISQKRADFMNTVFTAFRKFGMENHPEYSVPALLDYGSLALPSQYSRGTIG